MTALHRLPTGGRIDRSTTLRLTVDGRTVDAHPGDTVASAMLAHGMLRVGPSIYRGRPRGIVSAGVEEPNALLQVLGPAGEPMLPATCVEAADGLAVETLSGVGRLEPGDGDTVHDKSDLHTDVLVVGAGPAGLAAALAASAGDARVVLVDDQPELGGSALSGAEPALAAWIDEARAELDARPEVRVLTRATAVGSYDENYVLVAQRGDPAERPARRRLWRLRAGHVVLATGAHERPLVFADNDRPGVMLASALRTYVNRFAVLPGRRIVVCTTNDTAYDAALDAAAAGATVEAVVDTRAEPPIDLVARAAAAGIRTIAGRVVSGVEGTERVRGVEVSPVASPSGARDAHGLPDPVPAPEETLPCDLLAVSGGWSPVVHLPSQAGDTLRYDAAVAAFVPDVVTPGRTVVGAARGTRDLAAALVEGVDAGLAATRATPYPGRAPTLPAVAGRPATPDAPVWLVPRRGGDPSTWRTHLVDQQRDATVADVWRATGTGMRSVEHVKRYTTIGTGQDQGRTSGVPAMGVVAHALGRDSPAAVGTTSFRAPYVPVSFAVLAGRDRGHLFDPARRTTIHRRHVEAGAVFEDVGQWRRPRYYPRRGEGMAEAVARECRAARTGVAAMDASTLGKIDVIGPDAAQFLDRVYTNGFRTLAVGRARYGMMCRADGMVFDDGVTIRLADDHFFLTTTTGNAAAVLDWFEEWHQTEWPGLDVTFTSVTEQWSTVAVVGPRSREVVAELAPALDCSAEAFGFMAVRETVLANGTPARIARVSFSGELAFEIHVCGWYGLALWDAVMAAGAPRQITPYGTETMHVLRAEKGFPVVGQDTDGTVTPLDLGMDWIVSTRKDFIGSRSLHRPDTARPDRLHLVGLRPLDPDDLLPEGAQLVADGTPVTPQDVPVPMLGHVTSSYPSATLGGTFALALVANGRERLGETVLAPLPDRTIAARVTAPIFYDPEGARRDG